MLSKIIYVISLVAIFVCEYLGLGYYLHECHKGRLRDSIIQMAMIIVFILIISVFTYIYNKVFNIF